MLRRTWSAQIPFILLSYLAVLVTAAMGRFLMPAYPGDFRVWLPLLAGGTVAAFAAAWSFTSALQVNAWALAGRPGTTGMALRVGLRRMWTMLPLATPLVLLLSVALHPREIQLGHGPLYLVLPLLLTILVGVLPAIRPLARKASGGKKDRSGQQRRLGTQILYWLTPFIVWPFLAVFLLVWWAGGQRIPTMEWLPVWTHPYIQFLPLAILWVGAFLWMAALLPSPAFATASLAAAEEKLREVEPPPARRTSRFLVLPVSAALALSFAPPTLELVEPSSRVMIHERFQQGAQFRFNASGSREELGSVTADGTQFAYSELQVGLVARPFCDPARWIDCDLNELSPLVDEVDDVDALDEMDAVHGGEVFFPEWLGEAPAVVTVDPPDDTGDRMLRLRYCTDQDCEEQDQTELAGIPSEAVEDVEIEVAAQLGGTLAVSLGNPVDGSLTLFTCAGNSCAEVSEQTIDAADDGLGAMALSLDIRSDGRPVLVYQDAEVEKVLGSFGFRAQAPVRLLSCQNVECSEHGEQDLDDRVSWSSAALALDGADRPLVFAAPDGFDSNRSSDSVYLLACDDVECDSPGSSMIWAADGWEGDGTEVLLWPRLHVENEKPLMLVETGHSSGSSSHNTHPPFIGTRMFECHHARCGL